jgi:hypothetical protein
VLTRSLSLSLTLCLSCLALPSVDATETVLTQDVQFPRASTFVISRESDSNTTQHADDAMRQRAAEIKDTTSRNLDEAKVAIEDFVADARARLFDEPSRRSSHHEVEDYLTRSHMFDTPNTRATNAANYEDYMADKGKMFDTPNSNRASSNANYEDYMADKGKMFDTPQQQPEQQQPEQQPRRVHTVSRTKGSTPSKLQEAADSAELLMDRKASHHSNNNNNNNKSKKPANNTNAKDRVVQISNTVIDIKQDLDNLSKNEVEELAKLAPDNDALDTDEVDPLANIKSHKPKLPDTPSEVAPSMPTNNVPNVTKPKRVTGRAGTYFEEANKDLKDYIEEAHRDDSEIATSKPANKASDNEWHTV